MTVRQGDTGVSAGGVGRLSALMGPARVALFLLLWAAHLPYWALRMRLYVQALPPYGGPRKLARWFSIRRDWARRIFFLARHICAMRLDLRGRVPEGGPYLFVSNHQSSADIILLLGTLGRHRVRFVCKKELKWYLPTVSPSLRGSGDAFVGYGRHRDLAEIERFGRELGGDGVSGVIFPEGVRSEDGSIAKFNRGGLRLLCRAARLPIVPVAIDGLWRARSLGRFFTRLPGLTARVWMGEPITFESYAADEGGTLARVEDAIADAVAGFAAEAAAGERAQVSATVGEAYSGAGS